MADSAVQSADPLGPDSRTTLLGSILHYWWIVLLTTVIFGVIGVAYTAGSQPVYEATASAIIDDPRAQDPFTVAAGGASTNQASERYLADQVEIMRSIVVATVAAESLDWEISPGGLMDASTVEGELFSNLIIVTVEADTPEHAQEAANAVVAAYIEVRKAATAEVALAAIASLDQLISKADERIAGVQDEIDAIRLGSEDRQELVRQLAEAQAELNAARAERDLAPLDSDRRVLLNARIDELARDFTAWDTILRIDREDDDITVLVATRDAGIADRIALVSRRDALSADALASTGGVLLVSPAELPRDPSGIPAVVVIAAALALGLALGAAIAYGLSLRKNTVTDRKDPQAVLGAPLIVEVPSRGGSGKAAAMLPMLYSPESDAAEAYRFAASAISGEQKRVFATGEEPARFLAVVSAAQQEGRAMLTANLAIASAQEGNRVLVVDADFDALGVSELLIPGEIPSSGLVDIVEGGGNSRTSIAHLKDIGGQDIATYGRGALDLLSRGSEVSSGSYFFKQATVSQMLEQLTSDYDLVLVDSPPVLKVAYSEPVVDLADGLMAVVNRGEAMDTVADLGNRLSVSDVPLIGYVFVR